MKKIALSFNVLAAIIAVTILQACASTAVTTQCATPTLTPATASGPAGSKITVTIATTTKGANLRYTDDDTTPTGGPSGHGTEIAAQSGPVPVVFGRTLKLEAIAYKTGLTNSSIAVGTYKVSP